MISISLLSSSMAHGGCVCDKMNAVFRCVFLYRGNNNKHGYYGRLRPSKPHQFANWGQGNKWHTQCSTESCHHSLYWISCLSNSVSRWRGCNLTMMRKWIIRQIDILKWLKLHQISKYNHRLFESVEFVQSLIGK